MYGHVVVDEAQDHSAVALRVIGRRSPAASMTLVGDVAQSTTPAGQERWADIFRFLVAGEARRGGDHGRRADDRLPRARADPHRRQPVAAAHRRRRLGQPQRAGRGPRRRPGCTWRRRTWPAAVAAEAARLHHRHRLTGVVAPLERHEAIAAALEAAGWRAVDHLHELAADEIPLFGPEQVKGLEFDGVVVVEPDEILGDTSRGARLLYVAMTRAVQELSFVTPHPAPTPALS